MPAACSFEAITAAEFTQRFTEADLEDFDTSIFAHIPPALESASMRESSTRQFSMRDSFELAHMPAAYSVPFTYEFLIVTFFTAAPDAQPTRASFVASSLPCVIASSG